MANELQINLSLNVNNQGYKYVFSQQVQANQNALGAAGEVVSVDTTAQTLPQASVTTSGYATFQNLDPTNYVTIGSLVSGTYYPFVKLKPGEIAVLRLQTGLTVQAQANTAPVLLSYMIQND